MKLKKQLPEIYMTAGIMGTRASNVDAVKIVVKGIGEITIGYDTMSKIRRDLQIQYLSSDNIPAVIAYLVRESQYVEFEDIALPSELNAGK